MKQISQNLALIFKNPKYIIAYFILVGILAYLWYAFTDFDLMRANYYDSWHFEIDAILSWMNIVLFPLFLVVWFYRSYTLGSYGNKVEKVGFFGGVISILISGSLCCGTSIFLVFGASTVTTFFSEFFPYGGLELKTFGVAILCITLFWLLNNLLHCSVKNVKTKK